MTLAPVPRESAFLRMFGEKATKKMKRGGFCSVVGQTNYVFFFLIFIYYRASLIRFRDFSESVDFDLAFFANVFRGQEIENVLSLIALHLHHLAHLGILTKPVNKKTKKTQTKTKTIGP